MGRIPFANYLTALICIKTISTFGQNSNIGATTISTSGSMVGSNGQPGEKKPLYFLGILTYSGSWPSGVSTRNVFELAMKHINQNPAILPGYELRAVWVDDKCDRGVGAHETITAIFSPPTKIMILGLACASVAITVAEFAPFYNLVQVSYGSVAPVLSDKSRFPSFFRMWPSETLRNYLLIDLMKIFNWKKVAIVYENYPTFSLVTDHLISLLEANNITLITSEIFQEDPAKPVKVLKELDARIIIANVWEDSVRRILCEAYKARLYGPNIVWHLIGWVTVNWWNIRQTNVQCTQKEMKEVAQGAMYAAGIMEPANMNTVGISGYTSQQIQDPVMKINEGLFGQNERFHTYDSVWACALALNRSIEKLDKLGKDLADFSYNDSIMGDIIKESMQDLVFQGGLGLRIFDEFGDPKVNFIITYQRNGSREEVGRYVFDDEGNAEITWKQPSKINWLGGRVPSDSTVVVDLPLYMNFSAFITLASLSALGILLSLVFLGVNFIFRNKRLIKMSSPRMNNLILLGCMSIFTTVFFYEQDEELTTTFCMVRVFTLTIGFSLAFGSLFSKTWRVHVIFASKKAKSVNIQDSQLFCIVLIIVCVNFLLLVTWVVADPFQRSFTTATEKVVDSEEDIAIRYRVSVCVSTYSTTFMGALCVIQGVILAFGAFLAWETKKVTVEALNDSGLIGTCIYNVLILSTLGVGLGYALSGQTHLVYALNSAFMILGTFCTQCIIFVPKVMAVARGQADVAPSTMKVEPTQTSTA